MGFLLWCSTRKRSCSGPPPLGFVSLCVCVCQGGGGRERFVGLQGHVTSYLGCAMETYTSVQAHHSDIRQLELTPAGVLSVADSELCYISRTGLPLYTLR